MLDISTISKKLRATIINRQKSGSYPCLKAVVSAAGGEVKEGIDHQELGDVAVQLYMAILSGGLKSKEVQKLLGDIGWHTLMCGKCRELREDIMRRQS